MEFKTARNEDYQEVKRIIIKVGDITFTISDEQCEKGELLIHKTDLEDGNPILVSPRVTNEIYIK